MRHLSIRSDWEDSEYPRAVVPKVKRHIRGCCQKKKGKCANYICNRISQCIFQATKGSAQAGHCTCLPTALAGIRKRLRQWGHGLTAGPEARTRGAGTGRAVRTAVSTARALRKDLSRGALASRSRTATLVGAVRRRKSKTPPRQTRTSTTRLPKSQRLPAEGTRATPGGSAMLNFPLWPHS